jgi:osmoprotectant transport system permease protein
MSYIFNGANWDMTDPMSIPNLLLTHLRLTFVSLAIALIIAFPLAFLVVRYKRLYLPVVTAAGIIYTIPSLALLPLLVSTPFGGLSNDSTVVIPLVLYAQVVLIRNIVAAVRAVDPALIEVGRAMGMNPIQLQLRVTLPLALPVIVAGIRVVVVTTIGIATVAPLVGVESLGFLIFQGISNHYPEQLIAGAITIIVLAVGADLLLLGLQSFLARGQQVVSAA